jgi:alkaline phosphatase
MDAVADKGHAFRGSIRLTVLNMLWLLLLTAISGCSGIPVTRGDGADQGQTPPKYVFLFIGDGMGPAQVRLADAVFDTMHTPVMTSFPVTGMVETTASDRYITDSAAAGTALATGSKTTIGTISMSGNHRDTLKTIAEMARSKGMKVGIVSSVFIDDATPACFYAHNAGRGNYYDIARQMAASGFDYFGGGYAAGNFPEHRLKAGPDRKDIADLMKSANYAIANNREMLRTAKPGTRCWAYTSYDKKAAMSHAMDRTAGEVSLAEFTREGIRLLENPGGFFMMVEGGRIDWACHANDAAAAAHDVAAFELAIEEALAFYRSHSDKTLIIVTADHECGGLSLGNNAGGYQSRFDLLLNQKISLQRLADKTALWKKAGNVTFAMALDSVKVYYGIGKGAADPALELTVSDRNELQTAYAAAMKQNAGGTNYPAGPDAFSSSVNRILNTKAGIGWTTNAHTAMPVQVFSIGQGSREFSGSYDNTDIAKKIMKLAGLQP